MYVRMWVIKAQNKACSFYFDPWRVCGWTAFPGQALLFYDKELAESKATEPGFNCPYTYPGGDFVYSVEEVVYT